MQPEIFFVTGTDVFRIREHVERMENGARLKYGDFSVSKISALDASVGELRSEIFSPPFFGGKRVLFVSDLLPSSTQKFSDEKKESLQKLVEKLPELPDGVVLFCIAPLADKRTTFYKNLLKMAKKVEEFLPMNEEEVIPWVMAKFQEKGKTVSVSQAKFVVDFCGIDLFQLSNEIEKLSLLGEEISKEMVQKHCVPHEELANFAFSGALEGSNPVEIITVFQDLVQSDSLAAAWNRDVLSSLRNLLKVALAVHGKEKSSVHPYVAQKLQPLAKKISVENAKKIWLELARIDIASKNGEISFANGETTTALLRIERLIMEIFP